MKFGTGDITSVVVVMMENHSFDSVLGWLYADQGNQPPRNIPAQVPATFDGLAAGTYWNSNPPGNPASQVFAGRGTPDFKSPDPNPNELFSDMDQQIFGPGKAASGAVPTMSGFIYNYASAPGVTTPSAIMNCYDPAQLPVHSWLARNFAVCDRWFGSCPSETFPNRSFLHAGTSFGRQNGCDGLTEFCIPPSAPFKGDRTVFNALDNIGSTWKVYNDSELISTARYQFRDLFGAPAYDPHFQDFSQFQADAIAGNLPTYAFLEPSFIIEPNDGHPPHDMRDADNFLGSIWDAVRTSPQWPNILWMIIYDEHGGCYDHVAPAQNAVNPDNSVAQYGFDFQGYGPRVPAIVVSPWIAPGTVFRAGPGEADYDHTSVIATIRDLVGLGAMGLPAPFQSKRVDAAPTLERLLTLAAPRAALSAAPAVTGYVVADTTASTSLSQVQRAAIEGTAATRTGVGSQAMVQMAAPQVLRTEKDAVAHLRSKGIRR